MGVQYPETKIIPQLPKNGLSLVLRKLMGVIIPVTFLNIFLDRPRVKPDKTTTPAAEKIVFARRVKKAIPDCLVKDYSAR